MISNGEDTMDWGMKLTIVGVIISAIGIPSAIAWYTNYLPQIKIIVYILLHKTFKIRIKGIKEYRLECYDIKDIENQIRKKFRKVNKISGGNNYIIVLIEDMSAPYKILILDESYDVENKYNIRISLEGAIDISYYMSEDNFKYLDVLDKLFELIEERYSLRSCYKLFTLEAIVNEKFLSKDIKLNECEDTNVEIDSNNKFLRINSNSINNIYKCLKKNIKYII